MVSVDILEQVKPIKFEDDAVELYYDNVKKFETTTDGITMSGAIAMGTNKITGMGDPTANQDAATKAYVDTQTSGLSQAADDLTAGDAAVTLATTSGNITIDAQGNDTDIIFKGTDGGSDITALTLDMSAGGTARFANGIEGNYLWGSKLSDNAVALYAGVNFEVLDHVHNTGFKLTNQNWNSRNYSL